MSSENKKLGILKRLNYIYFQMVCYSLIFDILYLTWIEAIGNVFFLAIFILILIYPRGGKWNTLVLTVLLILCILVGIFVIYINTFSLDLDIWIVSRVLIILVWIYNITFYVIALGFLKDLNND
jgi:hypothetical protein